MKRKSYNKLHLKTNLSDGENKNEWKTIKKKVSVTESSSVHKVHAKDVDEINEPHYRSYKDDLKAEKRSYR